MNQGGKQDGKAAAKTEAKPIANMGDFLLNAPLYALHAIEEGRLLEVLGWATDRLDRFTQRHDRYDGYCPYCKLDTPFKMSSSPLPSIGLRALVLGSLQLNFTLTCTRADHVLHYWALKEGVTLRKIGQYPSLADIANDETRTKYRAVLRGDNSAELYKAIGLAAHGEGIGSFVYLRRILERLIRSRFDEYKEAEKWDEKDFVSLRMVEKIEFLKDHLPPSLMSIRKIYGIFSQGLHELDNEACLKFFDVGKRSIILILQDDLKKKEELDARAELMNAVTTFEGKT